MGNKGKMTGKCLKAAILSAVMLVGFWLNASLSHELTQVDAASPGELNIYGIYLSKGEGDATLLENNGEFLLMDMGKAEGLSSVKAVLREQGVKKLTLYISHYHADHYGGSDEGVATGIRELAAAGIHIDTMYLPDPTIIKEAEGSDPEIKCQKLTEAVEEQGGKVIQLRKGAKFQFGAVSAEVIGPIEKVSLSECGGEDKQSMYQNNYSLVTMMTFGKTKFFTAGDIHDAQEKLLVKEYGSKLKADIMKLSHHGTSTANGEEILECIQPTYAFGLNTNHTTITSSNHQETFGSKERTIKHGICYMTGEEKQSIRIQIANGRVTMYRYQGGKSTKLSGWVTLKGGDGKYYKTDKFYLDANGVPLTGVQKLNGKYYFFGPGGHMIIGQYNTKGVYIPRAYFPEGIRYIYKDGHMAVGFTTVGKRLYYYGKDGLLLDTKKAIELKKIEGKYYAIIKGGIIYTGNGKGGFRKLPDGHRYFNGKGVMQTGWKTFKGAKYYLDKETGIRVTGYQKIGGKTYYFSRNGQCKREIDVKKVAKFKGKAGKKQIVFTWKKNGNVNGYEIYLSTKKNSGYKRKAQITSRSTTKYTINKLISKKTYYAKICTYTTINGETGRGSFSKPIAIKVK